MTLCRAARFEPFEWQQGIIDDWLAVRDDGRWAATTCGLSVPRQNGKTLGVTSARIIAGMLLMNELVLYTSHLQSTSRETFEGIAELFERPRLKKYVKSIQAAIGRESIVLKSGARVKFVARTRKSGRGQHCDLLIFDEAQELTEDQQSGLLPAKSASVNPQVVYTGTPPDESAPGSVFRRIRTRALKDGAEDMAWAEWSAPEIGDVSDRERWYETNPSMGLLIREDTVAGECNDMSADKFARERLGWWSPTAEQGLRLISAPNWEACRTDDPPEDGLMALGIKFAPDGSRLAMAACIKPEEGIPYIEVIKSASTGRGTKWVAPWVNDRRDRIAAVSIDGKRGERVVQQLNELKFPRRGIMRPGSGEVAKACASLVDSVAAHDIEHYGQPDLDRAATGCIARKIGTDGFGFGDFEDADATLIEACALAYQAAMTTRRKPGRKGRIL